MRYSLNETSHRNPHKTKFEEFNVQTPYSWNHDYNMQIVQLLKLRELKIKLTNWKGNDKSKKNVTKNEREWTY